MRPLVLIAFLVLLDVADGLPTRQGFAEYTVDDESMMRALVADSVALVWCPVRVVEHSPLMTTRASCPLPFAAHGKHFVKMWPDKVSRE